MFKQHLPPLRGADGLVRAQRGRAAHNRAAFCFCIASTKTVLVVFCPPGYPYQLANRALFKIVGELNAHPLELQAVSRAGARSMRSQHHSINVLRCKLAIVGDPAVGKTARALLVLRPAAHGSPCHTTTYAHAHHRGRVPARPIVAIGPLLLTRSKSACRHFFPPTTRPPAARRGACTALTTGTGAALQQWRS